MQSPRGCFSVINLNTLDPIPVGLAKPEPMDYEAETAEQRTGRREQRWTPVIGPTRYSNLFLNTGHGTLGWTHACGSGKSLADIVSGRVPEVDFAFQGLQGRPRVTALQPSRTAA